MNKNSRVTSNARSMLMGKSIRLPRIGKGQVPKQVPSSILADCLWQGIKFMAGEVKALDQCDSSRASSMMSRCEFALLMHYHLLGYSDSEARGLVYEFLESIRKGENHGEL